MVAIPGCRCAEREIHEPAFRNIDLIEQARRGGKICGWREPVAAHAAERIAEW